MSTLLLPIAQFMPGFDPVGSMIGCWLYLFLFSLYVTGLVAVGAGIRSRVKGHPSSDRVARWMGAFVFAGAFLLLLFFSRAMIRSYRGFSVEFLVAAGAPAVLGVVAWILGARAAPRREILLAPVVVMICTGMAVVMMRNDLDFRRRRDALLVATRSGDAASVRGLLSTGLDADLRDDSTNTLLMLAPDAETSEAVLAAGARIDADPRALAWAAQSGNVPKMKVLLAHGADPNRMMGDKSPALLAWWAKEEAALELLRQAGSRDAGTLQRATGALTRAVEAGDADAVRRVLSGEFVMEERIEGLKVAAKRGDAAVLSLLMASTMAHSEISQAALIAVEHDQVGAYRQMMDELYRRRAGFILVETTDAALAIAARRGNPDIARDAMARAEPGMPSPLDRAKERGDRAVVGLLERVSQETDSNL